MRRGSRPEAGPRQAQLRPPRRPPVSQPVSLGERLQSLVAKATSTGDDQEARAKALQSLCGLLRSQEGYEAVEPHLSAFWPRILRLLSEPSPAVRKNAAPAAGILGALAARAPDAAKRGLPPSTLFDWSLPLLRGETQPPADLSSQFWALLALREGLAAMEPDQLQRWAGAVLDMCEQLLDAEDTSPHLLQPLLGVVSQAGRHVPALKARVKVFIDILLGWALDPALPDPARPAIASSLVSFHTGWPRQPGFTEQLVLKLLADMEGHIKTAVATDVDSLRRFLGFSSCIAAISRACATALQAIFTGFPQLLPRAIRCMTTGHERFQPMMCSQEGIPNLEEDLCVPVDTLVTIAANVHLLAGDENVEESSEAPRSTPPMQLSEAYSEVMGFVFQQLTSKSSTAASICAALRLHLKTLQLIQRQQGTLPLEPLGQLLHPNSAFPGLRLSEDSSVLLLVLKTYTTLLDPSQAPVAKATLQHLLDGLAPGASGSSESRGILPNTDLQPEASLDIHDRSLLGELSLGALRHAMQTFPDFSLIWKALWSVCQPAGALGPESALHAKALETLRSSSSTTILGPELIDGLANLASPKNSEATRIQALLWLSDVWLQAALKPQQGSQAAKFVTGGSPSSWKAASIVHTAPSASRSTAEQTEESNGTEYQDNCKGGKISDQEEGEGELRDAGKDRVLPGIVWAALSKAAGDRSRAVRSAAAQAILHLVKWPGLVMSHEATNQLQGLAAERMGDVCPQTGEAWDKIARALAEKMVPWNQVAETPVVDWHHEIALQPQQKLIRAGQLPQLINFMARAGRNAAWDPGGGATTWLLRLLSSCPDRPEAACAFDARDFSTEGKAGWFAVQEAAKQVVALRLRTSFGNPTQTFAALEKALQHTLSAPLGASDGSSRSLFPGYKNARLFLEFMGSLERGIFAAQEGCADREEPSAALTAFFTANKKVCEEWFSRIRPLLMRLANSVDDRPGLIFHSYMRIGELKAQLRELLLAPKTPEGAEIQGFQDSSAEASSGSEQQPKLLRRRGGPDVIKEEEARHGFRMPTTAAQKLAHELNSILQRLAAALVSEGCSEAIAGLHAYCIRSFSPLQTLLIGEEARVSSLSGMLSWMPAMQLQASGCFEEAQIHYSRLLESLRGEGPPQMWDDSMPFMWGQAGEAYAAISDWEGFERFLARLEELKTKSDASAAALRPPQPLLNCHLALMSFERKDPSSAQSLLELSKWSDHSLKQLGKPFFPGKLAAAADAGMLRALLAVDGRPKGNSRLLEDAQAVVSQAEESAMMPLKLLGAAVSGSAAESMERLQLLQLLGQGAPDGSLKASREDIDSLDLSGIQGSSSVHTDFLQVQPTLQIEQISRRRALDPAWLLRALNAMDPLVLLPATAQNLVRLSREAAAAGNLGFAKRLLARLGQSPSIQESPSAAHIVELSRLRIEGKSIEAALTVAQLAKGIAGEEKERVGDCSNLAAAAAETLAEWAENGGDDWAAVHESIGQLGEEYGVATEMVGNEAGKRSQLKLLVQATQHAPLSAAAWAGLSNWLHARLSDEATEEMRALALNASCRRLRTAAAPEREATVAAPELLRILKTLEAGCSPDVAQQVLELVPTALWQAVVPQLFSHLCSSKNQVRDIASRVLHALEEIVPAAVLYPALAEETDKKIEGSRVWELVERYRRRDPVMVTQLECMIAGLARITVLPNEEWHAALIEIQADVFKRITAVQAEAARLKDQREVTPEARLRLLKERFVTIMAPAAVALQKKLQAPSIRQPQTPHEAWFCKHYRHKLLEAVAALQNPNGEVLDKPELAAAALKSLVKLLGASLRETSIKLSSVSPELAALTDTAIPMPGMTAGNSLASRSQSQGGALETGLTVISLGSSLELLSTRTRPKKLTLLASNGEAHTFLLKGREDLRLDVRLLQFVRLASTMLTHDPQVSGLALRVRDFAVTPLTHQVGLVEWMEGTRPIFSVHTDWQNFAARRAAALKAEAGSREDRLQKPEQQSETAKNAFYAKLLPALEAAGIDRMTPRKEWPLDVLKQVLAGLVRGTPRNLLERQIWCGSASSSDWWRRQQSYATSTAVMSMVGYLMGLGDRHLGNILLDQRTAQVVHIDFNIIFDRGKKLPVPEIVPFRLTQIMQGALGVTGVEGPFRLACQAVLACMRRGSGTALLMMEAILEDNLVDWAPDRPDAAANEAMDLGVRFSLLCSRLDEIEPSLRALLEATSSASARCSAFRAFSAAFQPAVEAARVAHSARLEADKAQARISEAREGLQKEWERAQAAASERGEALEQLQRAQAAADVVLRDLKSQCDHFSATGGRLRLPELPELQSPLEYWVSTKSQAPLGLKEGHLSSGGSVIFNLQQASGSFPKLPAGVVDDCATVDQQAIGLLQARDAALYACFTAAQEYAQASQVMLDGSYWQSSHHLRWLAALSTAAQGSSAEDFAVAKRFVSENPVGLQLRSIWEALDSSRLCWQTLPAKEQLREAIPAAIFRADANAAERELQLLKPRDTHSLRSAIGAVLSDILHSLGSLAGIELDDALHQTLRGTLEATSLAASPSQAASELLAAAGVVGALNSSTACIVSLMTASDIGRRAFLPELAGFGVTGQEAKSGAHWMAEVERCHSEARSLEMEASSLEEQHIEHEETSRRLATNEAAQVAAAEKALQKAAQPGLILMPEAANSLSARKESLQVLERDLAAKQQALASAGQDLSSRHTQLQQRAGALSARFMGLMSSSSPRQSGVSRATSPVAALLGTFESLYALLKKLKGPLEDLLQASATSSTKNALWPFQFHFFCISTAAELLAAVQSQPQQIPVLSAYSELDSIFCRALGGLLSSCVLPSLKLVLERARSSCLPSDASRQGPDSQGSKAEDDDSAAASSGATPRLTRVVKAFAEARAGLQLSEYRLKAREVEAVVEGWRLWASKRQAACEWLLQEINLEAVSKGASQLEALKSKGLLASSLRGRGDMIRSLHVAVKSIQSATEEIEEWRLHSSIPAEKQLYSAVQTRDEAALPQVKHYLALREQWFILSQEQAAGFQDLGEGILKLEASRDGRRWRDGNLDPDPFPRFPDLLAALELHFQAMHSADRTVAEARDNSRALQEDGAAAHRQLSAYSAEATQAGSNFVVHAPRLVESALQLLAAAEDLAAVSSRGVQAITEAVAALEDLNKSVQAKQKLEAAQSAVQLHQKGGLLRSELARFSPGILKCAEAMQQIGLPSLEEVQRLSSAGEKQSLTAAAAAVVDAVVPIAELEFGGQWPDLDAHNQDLAAFKSELIAFRDSLTSIATAIQQEHGLPAQIRSTAGEISQEQLRTGSGYLKLDSQTVSAESSQAAAERGFQEHLSGQTSLPHVAEAPNREPTPSESARLSAWDGGRDSQHRGEKRARTRRAFAEGTLRRFRAKLEGLKEQQAPEGDLQKGVQIKVEDQVERLLQQATSHDNLALMFEGWTAWI